MTALFEPRRWLRAVAVLCLALGTAPAPAEPALQASSVKAAYLQKFPGFVEWPPEAFSSSGAPFLIGVAGADAVFDELLDAMRAGRRIQGRALDVRLVAAGALPRGLHLLYIGRDAAAEAPALIAETRGTHILLVTDLPAGLQLGAALNFVEWEGRVRFEASPGAARRADLKLGSSLLSVAARVAEDNP